MIVPSERTMRLARPEKSVEHGPLLWLYPGMDRPELLRSSARLWRELAASHPDEDAKTLLAMARELDAMAAELDGQAKQKAH